MDSSKFEKKDGVYFVTGVIDGFFDYKRIVDMPDSEIILDLGGVETMNSMGIKGWLLMNRSLGEKRLTLRNLPFIMVSQFLMIDGLRGDSTIESVRLPYYCEDCDVEHQILFKVEDIKRNGIPEKLSCDSCEGEVTFDEADSVGKIIIEDWNVHPSKS